MESWEKAESDLTKKILIIKKIAANTETQHRFIHKREMKGLGRVLGERDGLLKELAIINNALMRSYNWKKLQELTPILQDISHQQQELLERSRQVLQEAVMEQQRIAAELKSSRIHRQVKSRYISTWTVIEQGKRINARG